MVQSYRDKKLAMIAQCVVPDWMRLDKHESVTQEQYTRGLTKAIDEIGLSLRELEEIRDGNIPKSQLRTYIPYR